MRVLAIDTAAGACSVAVWDGATLHQQIRVMDRGHAEALVPLLLQVMQDAGCGFADLGLLAVTVGPGAFTGLRIGLATARGLCAATGLPCLGVTTLEAVAAAAGSSSPADRPLLVALDTRRGDVYAQAFLQQEALGEPEVATPEGLALRFASQRLVVAGDACAAVLAAMHAVGAEAVAAPGVAAYPVAGQVARIALERWLAGVRPLDPPAPLYLRAPATGPQQRHAGSGR